MRTPRRTAPPPPAACGVADETTSFGANVANAELVNASDANAPATSSARRLVLLIESLPPLSVSIRWVRERCDRSAAGANRASAAGGHKRADGDPMHPVVADELRLADRVVVAGARHDPDAGAHERVRLVQVLRRGEQRLA